MQRLQLRLISPSSSPSRRPFTPAACQINDINLNNYSRPADKHAPNANNSATNWARPHHLHSACTLPALCTPQNCRPQLEIDPGAYKSQLLSNGGGQSLLVSANRHLHIQRVRETDSGLYECIASNSHDNDLRKLVHIQVRGK